ncbi:hypothetical protein TESG_01129 [Trichophyton tonsurans CBS 112818]|uniref:Uncharacterized protein n=1 Tax=Trichophyton tonsurans (strain CBS 112818) TaxID=647933 RepID=F2RQI8_TRIT1|nr:hypothetical protein TESG_01129 [Trichophyton tonsurans CBS 112818]
MVSDTSSTSDSSSERGYSRRHKKRHRIRRGDRRRQPATNTDRTLDMLILVFVEHMKVEIENAKMRLSKAKESQSRKEKWTPPLQSRRKRVYGDPMPIDSFEKVNSPNETGYRHTPDSETQPEMHEYHCTSSRGP